MHELSGRKGKVWNSKKKCKEGKDTVKTKEEIAKNERKLRTGEKGRKKERKEREEDVRIRK